MDTLLIQRVAEWRNNSYIVIDSHPVTKESFGFRVTPFSLNQLSRVAPTLVFNLYADPEVILQRINANAQGRPHVTAYEAGYHNGLQGVVAITYGIQIGVPIYMLDSSKPTDELVEQVRRRLK